MHRFCLLEASTSLPGKQVHICLDRMEERDALAQVGQETQGHRRVTHQPGKRISSSLKGNTQETDELRTRLSPMKGMQRAQEEKQNLPSSF